MKFDEIKNVNKFNMVGKGKGYIILRGPLGYEKYCFNKNYSGYTVPYKNTRLEFCCSSKSLEDLVEEDFTFVKK